MRWLVMALVTLAVLVLGFWAANMETVPVTIWFGTTFPEVPLGVVVVIAVAAGAVFSGLIAVFEGARIRLDNRRLRKKVQRLEAEPAQPKSERTASAARATAREEDRPKQSTREEPATAPVYESDRDPDDDPYSGGRAV